MRDPIVNEEADFGVGEEVEGFFRGRIRSHDYNWSGWEIGRSGGGAGCGREIGVIHKGDVGDVGCAGCEM